VAPKGSHGELGGHEEDFVEYPKQVSALPMTSADVRWSPVNDLLAVTGNNGITIWDAAASQMRTRCAQGLSMAMADHHLGDSESAENEYVAALAPFAAITAIDDETVVIWAQAAIALGEDRKN
jgi:hypothetical protein